MGQGKEPSPVEAVTVGAGLGVLEDYVLQAAILWLGQVAGQSNPSLLG